MGSSQGISQLTSTTPRADKRKRLCCERKPRPKFLISYWLKMGNCVLRDALRASRVRKRSIVRERKSLYTRDSFPNESIRSSREGCVPVFSKTQG